jgi:hypothetical protein
VELGKVATGEMASILGSATRTSIEYVDDRGSNEAWKVAQRPVVTLVADDFGISLG